MLPPIFFLNTMTLSINEIANLTKTAIHAARLGGAILQDYAKKGFTIHSKGQAINLVTEADLRSEEAIIQSIRNTFPEHQILSEEQGLQDIPNIPSNGSSTRSTERSTSPMAFLCITSRLAWNTKGPV